jgi:hypothetical protein
MEYQGHSQNSISPSQKTRCFTESGIPKPVGKAGVAPQTHSPPYRYNLQTQAPYLAWWYCRCYWRQLRTGDPVTDQEGADWGWTGFVGFAKLDWQLDFLAAGAAVVNSCSVSASCFISGFISSNCSRRPFWGQERRGTPNNTPTDTKIGISIPCMFQKTQTVKQKPLAPIRQSEIARHCSH